jgi:hypothetical protein
MLMGCWHGVSSLNSSLEWVQLVGGLDTLQQFAAKVVSIDQEPSWYLKRNNLKGAALILPSAQDEAQPFSATQAQGTAGLSHQERSPSLLHMREASACCSKHMSLLPYISSATTATDHKLMCDTSSRYVTRCVSSPEAALVSASTLPPHQVLGPDSVRDQHTSCANAHNGKPSSGSVAVHRQAFIGAEGDARQPAGHTHSTVVELDCDSPSHACYTEEGASVQQLHCLSCAAAAR